MAELLLKTWPRSHNKLDLSQEGLESTKPQNLIKRQVALHSRTTLRESTTIIPHGTLILNNRTDIARKSTSQTRWLDLWLEQSTDLKTSLTSLVSSTLTCRFTWRMTLLTQTTPFWDFRSCSITHLMKKWISIHLSMILSTTFHSSSNIDTPTQLTSKPRTPCSLN